jgi:ribosomal protein S27AE
MKGKPPMSLAEMAARAVDAGRLACSKCGCRDFRTHGVREGEAVTFRYKVCRNCGKTVYTGQGPEFVIRDVGADSKPAADDFGGSIV